MDDKKILLIIDGLDEWTDEMAALQAIRRVEIFTSSKGLPVIYSSRPYGFKLLENSIQNANKHQIANFSIGQQKKFVYILFKKLLKDDNITTNELSNAVIKRTDDFIIEVNSINEVGELAQNPLMLSVLFGQKIRHAVLPRNKFQAYNEITKYFIEQHPRRRKTEANITDDVHPELVDHLTKMYSLLAFRMQVESADGVFDKKRAAFIIEEHLQNELGFSNEKSKKESHNLIELGENFIGILAEKSPKEVSFIHRQFQEFLCAKYLSELSLEEIRELILNKCSIESWHQVIYYTFYFIHRQNEFASLLESVENAIQTTTISKQNLKLLKYNIGINVSVCPLFKCLEILLAAFEEFTFNSNLKFKENLLEIILQGIQNPKIKDKIINWVKQWNPYNFPFTDYRLNHIKLLTNVHTQPYLETVFFNGELRDQLKSSFIIGDNIKSQNNRDLITKFANLSLKDSDEIIRALSINVLIACNNVESLKKVIECYDTYPTGTAPILKFFTIKCKVILRLNNDHDLQKLIGLQPDLPYELRDEVDDVFIEGWKNSTIFLEECLLFINKDDSGGLRSRFDFTFRDHFWKVFIECFHERDETIQIICKQIQSEDRAFSLSDERPTWVSLERHYSLNPQLISVLHSRFFNEENPKFFEVIETYYAAKICRTEHAKNYLIKHLHEYHWNNWIVDRLIETWKKDKNVIEALRNYLFDSNHIQWVLHVAYFLVDTKQEFRSILLEKLNDRTFSHRLAALHSFINDKEYFEINILNEFIDNELPRFKKTTSFPHPQA